MMIGVSSSLSASASLSAGTQAVQAAAERPPSGHPSGLSSFYAWPSSSAVGDTATESETSRNGQHGQKASTASAADQGGAPPAIATARDHLLSMLRQEESGEYVPACDYVGRGGGPAGGPDPSESFDEAVNFVRPEPDSSASSAFCPNPQGAPSRRPPPRMPQDWRLKITEWTFEAIDHFDLDRDVASHALSYLDRAVATVYSRGKALSKTSFQLIAMTSLYVAVKIHGAACPSSHYAGVGVGVGVGAPSCPVPCELETFVRLGRGMFSPQVIQETEMWLLETLRWRMNPPTAGAFASYLLQLALYVPDPRQETQHDSAFPDRFDVREVISHHQDHATVQCLFDLSRYLTEMSACDWALSLNCSPSAAALAAVLNACDAVEAAPGGRLPPGTRGAVAEAAANLGLGVGTTKLRHDSDEVMWARTRLAMEVCPTMDLIERYPIPVAVPPSPRPVPNPILAAVVTPGGTASPCGRKRRLSYDEGAAAAAAGGGVQRYSPNCVTDVP